MSARAIEHRCPGCGYVLGIDHYVVIEEEPGDLRQRLQHAERQPSPQPAQQQGPVARCEHDGANWWINCPVIDHGRHKAREWEAQGNAPAVVKCTGKLADGKYCTTKTALSVARQQAGLS